MNVWKEGKEGNVLLNNALNTFYLRLYGVSECLVPVNMTNVITGISDDGSINCNETEYICY